MPDDKSKTLQKHGVLNPRPNAVTDPSFADEDFFDPRDLVQVKYEMLRKVRLDGESVTDAASSFGFSRVSFYKTLDAFEEQGVAGLVPRKRGPRGGHKLTAEVIDFMRQKLTQEDALSATALVELVRRRFGITVHARTVERALTGAKKRQ